MVRLTPELAQRFYNGPRYHARKVEAELERKAATEREQTRKIVMSLGRTPADQAINALILVGIGYGLARFAAINPSAAHQFFSQLQARLGKLSTAP